jgi:AraC-like DNA-binding protein
MSRKIGNNNSVYAPRSQLVDDAISLFHSEYAHPFEVSAYAKSCNVSASCFARKFKQQIGISPLQYLIDVRINKACELLNTSVSVREISSIVGYDDPLYFSRLFKKHTGMSPRQYYLSQINQHNQSD